MMLTPAQQHALEAAAKSCTGSLDKIQSIIPMEPEARAVLRRMIIIMQLGAVREVAQLSANERAEIAGLTDRVILEFSARL